MDIKLYLYVFLQKIFFKILVKLEQIKMSINRSLVKIMRHDRIYLASSINNKNVYSHENSVFLNFHVSKTECLSLNKTLKIYL